MAELSELNAAKTARKQAELILQQAIERERIAQEAFDRIGKKDKKGKQRRKQRRKQQPSLDGAVNRNGNVMKWGTRDQGRRAVYCGAKINDTGSDGSCGPNDGPQCDACRDWQRENLTNLGWKPPNRCELVSLLHMF